MSQHDDRPAARPVAAAPQGPAAAEEADAEGAFAERIVRLARERGVRLRSEAELAETLRVAELEREIPYAPFAAVAEILTHLYRANAAGAHEEEPREP